MLYQLYFVKNKVNNKIYIGVHYGDIFEDDYYGSGILIQNAIDKYGKYNLERSVISEYENESLAYFVERMLVGEDVVKCNDFYNLMEGGRGRSVGTVLTEEVKRKIGKANSGENNGMFGYEYSDEERKILGKKSREWHSKNESPKPFLGKKHTEETKKKISKINKKLSKDQCKSVVCIETGDEFNSITEAAEFFGLSLSTVSHHCNGRVDKKKFKFI